MNVHVHQVERVDIVQRQLGEGLHMTLLIVRDKHGTANDIELFSDRPLLPQFAGLMSSTQASEVIKHAD